MRIFAILKKIFQIHPFALYSIMIVLGILSGVSESSGLQNVGQFISNIFIRMFGCVSLPIVALSLIVTLSSYHAEGVVRQFWHRTIIYTLGTTMVAAAVSCMLYLLIHPPNVNSAVSSAAYQATQGINYWQQIENLVPTNIFSPFLEHQVMGVLFLGIIIGIAIRYIPNDNARNAVIYFFQGIHGLFLVITKWIVAVLPLGLYGFITTTVTKWHGGMSLHGIGKYLVVLILANLIQGFVILPTWLMLNKIKPWLTMRRMLPALSVAFFSKSSVGTLPVTMDTIEKHLQVNPKISRLILPLCTNINMNGCAAFIFTTVIYLMQNHGIPITLGTLAVWVVIATIAAVGNAGVPMGCFFLSTSLLASMNVPIALLGIILPFYSLIDMLETALNVWSDSCIAIVLNKNFQGKGLSGQKD